MAFDAQGNQWSIFGYDVRYLGRQWTSAWRAFLFGDGSPLRARFDEPVRLVGTTETTVYQGGERRGSSAGSTVRCEAVAVPESHFLARTLQLPAAAEAELDAVLAMEIAANSPFDPADTASGWSEAGRSGGAEGTLRVALAVAARSALMEWLGAAHADRRADTTELWAQHEGAWIRLEGFGEGRRETLYRSRLRRLAFKGGAIVTLLFVVAGLFALQQRVALTKLEAELQRLSSEAQTAAEHRRELVAANEAIAAANALIDTYPNPHLEIARLTDLLGDDAYVAHFSIRGRDLRLRGRASDAAGVMQVLSEQPAFSSVTAPQAITAAGNSGTEQFYLDLRLGDASGEGS